MSAFLQDLRLALRQLRQRPLFTLTAVLTLAIGIGVNAVAFTVVNGILFKGSALRGRDDIGRVMMLPGGDEGGNASLAEYQRFADATRGALDLAAEGRLAMAWQHGGATHTAWVLLVSSNYFSMVDARPLAGQVTVTRADDVIPSVVIGERFWRRSLNAASLAGLTLRLNDTEVSVAGVLPESFQGPAGIYSPDVWLALDDLDLFNTSQLLRERDRQWLFLFGRLLSTAGVPEVQGRLDAAVAATAREDPAVEGAGAHGQRTARFRLFSEGNSELRGLRAAAAMAMGVIGLVLLLACFNVANLLLARAIERERDMAIRVAIGASATRLLRLVVTEGCLVAGLAGAAALVLTWWTQSLIGSFAIPIDQPQHIDLSPDFTVLAFVATLIAVAGVLPGVWPALIAARVNVLRALGAQGTSSAGGRPSPLRRWLVGAQVAGSTAFLALAGLLAQSYANLARADMGFDEDTLVVAEFEPASHGYDAARSQRYLQALLSRVEGLPGVNAVAVADRAPFFIGFDRMTAVYPSGTTCDATTCQKFATLAVGPGYFNVLGTPLISGREFARGEAKAEVIINQPLARALWPDGLGLGESINIGDRGSVASVVGITARAHTRGLEREQPTLYVPLAQEHFDGPLSVIVRTAAAPELLVRPFADAAQAVDPRVSMLSVKTMEQRMAVQLWPFRTVSWLFSICGALALVLATVGLAGVVIHAVNRRTREFGVRLSMGATPRDLAGEVLHSSAALLVPGLIAGTLLAAGVARLFQFAIHGVDSLNPLTYLVVALLQCGIVTIACVGPALRASRVDPLIALRSD